MDIQLLLLNIVIIVSVTTQVTNSQTTGKLKTLHSESNKTLIYPLTDALRDVAEKNNIVESLFKLLKVTANIWHQCLYYTHYSPAAHGVEEFSSFPCFRGKFTLKTTSWSYTINVNRLYQINLTMTNFDLKRGTVECRYHYIKVGASLGRSISVN